MTEVQTVIANIHTKSFSLLYKTFFGGDGEKVSDSLLIQSRICYQWLIDTII